MDKRRIKIILKLHKTNEMSRNEALNEILDICKDFKAKYFLTGMALGTILGIISMIKSSS